MEVQNSNQNVFNPFPIIVKMMSCFLACSFINLFYATSIDILQYGDEIKNCWNNYNTTDIYTEDCNNLLEKFKTPEFLSWTTWSIYVLSVAAPIKILFMQAYFATTDEFKRYQNYLWACFITLIICYIGTMLVSISQSDGSYFYTGIPVFIGIPLGVVIPYYYKIILKEKNTSEIQIPVIVIILYSLTVIGTIVLSFYIVWRPKSDHEILQRAWWLHSCASYFAWLGSQILVGEIFFTFVKQPVTFSLIEKSPYQEPAATHEINSESSAHIDLTQQQNNSVTVQELYNIIYKNYVESPYLSHILSLIIISFFISWGGMSNLAAIISILAFDIIFPVLVFGVDKLQSSFDNFVKHKIYKLN
jgi:hypothetical protein